jgi:hypothetical protein
MENRAVTMGSKLVGEKTIEPYTPVARIDMTKPSPQKIKITVWVQCVR